MNATEADGGHVFYIRGTRQENLAFAAFYTLVLLIAVPGNVVALWAFFRQTASSPSKVFLRHLAIADMSYVLLLPMRVAYHLSDSRWHLGEGLCRLAGFLCYIAMYVGLYLVTFISLDRLLVLFWPGRSFTARKPRNARVAVAALWFTVVVSKTPGLLSKRVTVDIDESTVTCNQLYLEKRSLGTLISTVVAFSVPLVAMVVSYVLILVKLKGLTQREERPVKDKAVRMIVLTVANFLLAFLPYHVSRVVYMTATPSDALTRANRITSAVTCVSGVLDPVLYFFLANTYRNTLRKLLCRSVDSDGQRTSNMQ